MNVRALLQCCLPIVGICWRLEPASGQILFSDDFAGGASPLWNNVRGNWAVSNGVYFATEPDNIPATFTGLPFVLQNFSVDLDINQVADGGIWLRSDPSGTNGVLLVTGGNGWGAGSRNPPSGTSLYWHVITDANYNNPPILNQAFNVFTNPGVQDVHLHVEVLGTLYSAYVNGSANPATTLVETNNTYTTGHVGLYDFSSQTFGNFVLQIPPGFGPYTLSIAMTAANQATLSWTTNATGWFLASTASLANPQWTPVTNTPAQAGTNFAVSLFTTNSPQFFRLQNQ